MRKDFKTKFKTPFSPRALPIPREDRSFIKFAYKPSGGTTSVAPTGTNKKYAKSHYDADVPEQFSTVVDVLDEWMFGESLDDFDPDVFDNNDEARDQDDDEIH